MSFQPRSGEGHVSALSLVLCLQLPRGQFPFQLHLHGLLALSTERLSRGAPVL